MTEDQFGRLVLLGLDLRRTARTSMQNHRRRFYRDPLGYFIVVKDTLEQPFIAEGFPRGNQLFEYVDIDETYVNECALSWKRQHGIKVSDTSQNYEILQLPARICRCRLFYLDACNLARSPDFTEVWDTVGKPFGPLEDLPQGKLIATEQDFSRMAVRIRMDAHWETYGVIDAGSWTLDGTA